MGHIPIIFSDEDGEVGNSLEEIDKVLKSESKDFLKKQKKLL